MRWIAVDNPIHNRKIPPRGGIFPKPRQTDLVAALLTLLAGLLTWVLLLLAGLLTPALLLPWLLIGVLALLTRILVRIILIAHVGISLVSHGEATTPVRVGFKGTSVPLPIF